MADLAQQSASAVNISQLCVFSILNSPIGQHTSQLDFLLLSPPSSGHTLHTQRHYLKPKQLVEIIGTSLYIKLHTVSGERVFFLQYCGGTGIHTIPYSTDQHHTSTG